MSISTARFQFTNNIDLDVDGYFTINKFGYKNSIFKKILNLYH